MREAATGKCAGRGTDAAITGNAAARCCACSQCTDMLLLWELFEGLTDESIAESLDTTIKAVEKLRAELAHERALILGLTQPHA